MAQVSLKTRPKNVKECSQSEISTLLKMRFQINISDRVQKQAI